MVTDGCSTVCVKRGSSGCRKHPVCHRLLTEIESVRFLGVIDGAGVERAAHWSQGYEVDGDGVIGS